MKIEKKFVVYRLDEQYINETKGCILQELRFKGYQANWFETEVDAIQALIEDGKTHEEFIILKSVIIRE